MTRVLKKGDSRGPEYSGLVSIRVPPGKPNAILRPKAAGQAIRVGRHLPRPSLEPYIEYLWLIRWDVPEPHRQQVVPQPRIHVATEHRRLLVHGISREPFHRTLDGVGHVLGVAFRPGGFRPFLNASVGSIAGTVQPAADLLDVDDRPVAARIIDGDDDADMVAAFQEYLEQHHPAPDPHVHEVASWVAAAESDSSLVRADALADLVGVSLRTLQRLFTEYVGIGPKWVIQRYRILDAVGAAHSGADPDLGDLAQRLGFSDQAHFTRVFTDVVGTPPAAYARDARTR